jgi:hypothetical protein
MNTAQSVRLNKQAHPERYCSNHYCLWKTAQLDHATQTFKLNANPCKRHVVDYRECRCENNGDYCDYCEPRNEPDLLEATWIDNADSDRYSDADFEHYKAQVKP